MRNVVITAINIVETVCQLPVKFADVRIPEVYSMNMNELTTIESVIRARHSVRNYESRPLGEGDRALVQEAITAACDPKNMLHPADIRIQLVRGAGKNSTSSGSGGMKLGTYGVIRGASDYLALAVPRENPPIEAAGYALERVILRLSEAGLGTCWLAGTWNRSSFLQAAGESFGMDLLDPQSSHMLVAVTPVGYDAGKKHAIDSFIRFAAGSRNRKPWKDIFFAVNPTSGLEGLESEAAGALALPFEMVRCAPSASNRQPWRLVRDGEAVHFFSDGTYGEALGFNMHLLDLGIAACHFDLSCRSRGMDSRPFFDKPPERLSALLPATWTWRFSFTLRE